MIVDLTFWILALNAIILLIFTFRFAQGALNNSRLEQSIDYKEGQILKHKET